MFKSIFAPRHNEIRIDGNVSLNPKGPPPKSGPKPGDVEKTPIKKR